MHGKEPHFTEEGDRLESLGGFRFNGITFRVFLCLLIVFVPSILAHLPLFFGGSLLRALIGGGLGVVISVLGAFLLSHFF